MFKKITSIVLTIMLLLLLSSPVYATQMDSTQEESRSIEEILDEYHSKAFEAQTSGEVTTYSLNNQSTASLEQDTVSVLNEAGYEAYNVTSENFSSLEEELKTDFSELGLDPDSSYIIVISGDENTSISPTGNDLILPPHIYDEVDNSFTYTYGGVSYIMRYITVTASSNSQLGVTSDVDVLEKTGASSVFGILNLVMTAVGTFGDPFGVGTVYSILTALIPDYEPDQSDSFEYRGGTNWTITYTQIYNSESSSWTARSSIEYVTMRYFIDYTYYDSSNNQYEQISTKGLYGTLYSKYYNDSEWRKETAVLAYNQGLREYDEIEEVYYKFGNKTVLTHQRWMEYLGYEP